MRRITEPLLLLAGGCIAAAALVPLLHAPGPRIAPPVAGSAVVVPAPIAAAVGDEPQPTAAVAADAVSDVPVALAPASATTASAGIAQAVSAEWVQRTAARTGIPPRALAAYAGASLAEQRAQPGCGIDWATLAGIGSIESDHGRHAGASVADDGWVRPLIVGPRLDGNGVAAVGDSDSGFWDGDTQWDHAVGPMQFIPDTWRRWGSDGDGDGTVNPNQIDDAALSAARYLCAGGSMTSSDGWRRAIFSYNHLDAYVDAVAGRANRYAEAAG